MAAAPSFLQLVFFILSLLAPGDAKTLTWSGNVSDTTEFVKTAQGSWSLPRDDSEWKVDGAYVAIHYTKPTAKDERIKVAPFVGEGADAVKLLTTHDWEKGKLLKLSRSLSVEKSEDGFILRMQKSADSPVVELRAVFGR